MKKNNLIIKCCNENQTSPESGNMLGGTYSYLTLQNPALERKNQDSIGIFSNGKQAVLIVADGIGGHRMGDEASKIAVSVIIDIFNKTPKISLETIFEAILEANKNIRALNVGAGTTLCLGHIEENRLTFFSIGDSRGLHISGKGNTKTQTLDHSAQGFALASDLFDRKEVHGKSGGNQLIYALGDETPQISVTGPVEINFRDIILLSSDGLTANLTDDQINQSITQGPINDRVEKLKELSLTKMGNEKGTPDDLSILLFSLGRNDSTEDLLKEEIKA